MLNPCSDRFDTYSGFAVGIVITTPPFPYYRENVPEPIGLPILFDEELTPEDRRNLHYGEVGLKGDVLVTSGTSGCTLVVTGTGETIEAARVAANSLAEKVIIPNGRYRSDIGQKLVEGEFAKIDAWGLLDADECCRGAVPVGDTSEPLGAIE